MTGEDQSNPEYDHKEHATIRNSNRRSNLFIDAPQESEQSMNSNNNISYRELMARDGENDFIKRIDIQNRLQNLRK